MLSGYSGPDTVLGNLHKFSLSAILWGRWYLLYFINEDTEASFDYIICPSSHSWTWKGWDLNPGLSDPKDFDPKTYKDPKNLIPDSDLDDENKMN